MDLIQTDVDHKYLLLTSVKDIIKSSKGKEFTYQGDLFKILIENAKSDEESVRNVVAECLGLLFIDNSMTMALDLGDKFNSPSKNILTTIAKSLKHSCNKVMNENAHDELKNLIPSYL